MNRGEEQAAKRRPGRGDGRCVVVGEVAMAHDGSLGLAHAFINAIADAGADAVKFQTHLARAESTPAEPWRVRFSPQDASRYAYWQRTAFTEEQWRGLRQHAVDRGLAFLSSPFSPEAVDLLSRVGVEAWKIASGEVGNTPMLEQILATRLPVILSSGMSSLAELDAAAALVKSRDVPLTILQCTSLYPCPPEKIGLNMLQFLRDRYDCSVGLSDHSGTIFPGLAAATLGAEFLEVHVTLSRQMFGPDVPVSLTPAEFADLVRGVRFIEQMRAGAVDKDAMAIEMTPLRNLFTKSVVARCNLAPGTVLQREHLALKKPGTGIAAAELDQVVGRTLRAAVEADQVLQYSDLD